jgi:hypothetical protein
LSIVGDRDSSGTDSTRCKRWLTALLRHLGVILVFAVPAVILWWHAWDGHLASTLACACGDPGQQVWFIAWPAYALQHGLNPFFAHQLSSPLGVNLLDNTSSPLVGLVLAPVTWAFGPIVATNVALTLAPALSAWACWVACRHFTTWRPAWWVAGLLYGYSPFVVDNMSSGHIQLSLLIVPPLLLVLAHRVWTGTGSAVLSGLGLGALVCVQFFLSTELLTVGALLAGFAVVVAALVAPRQFARAIRRAGPTVAVGAGVALAVLAYPTWFALDGPRHLVGPPFPGIQIDGIRLSDLWNAGKTQVRASGLVRLGGYEGRAGPPGAYLGTGTLVLLVIALGFAWRRRAGRFVALVGLIALILSNGLLLWVSEDHVVAGVWLPWRALDRLPLLDRVAPARIVAFADLFLVLVLAIGADRAWSRLRAWRDSRTQVSGVMGSWRRVLAGGGALALGALCILPTWSTFQVPLATRALHEPRWFATAGTHLAPGAVVLSYPFAFPSAGTSAPMVWQAEDAMDFSLAGGYIKVPGRAGHALSAQRAPSTQAFLAALSEPQAGPLPHASAHQLSELDAALGRWRVTDIVVLDQGRAPTLAAETFAAALGQSPTHTDGALVWTLHPSRPSPHPGAALGARSLAACTKPASDQGGSVLSGVRCVLFLQNLAGH